MNDIRENLAFVRDEIVRACERAGRDPKGVRLIAVSKTKPVADMIRAFDEGVRDFGENYVQEIVEKYDELPVGASIHMIGHLQTNKVKKVIGRAVMIHSVDSVRLASEISKSASKLGIRSDILLEVNIAAERSKYGFLPEELSDALCGMLGLPNIRIRGLMTSAPIVTDPEDNREYFRKMRGLLTEMRELMAKKGFSETELPTELSMGMTGDFIPAVEEGATMVRIGTAIFGERSYV
ncbi:MAG TPA: YggS family pyridoxal phosphate-dependent enzyme [Candidatus Avilachnospira avistercoris]|nr:YggS family pyridoxal phosphate-dependent enzyme [Candidatus Avilachnospira avistercoris]